MLWHNIVVMCLSVTVLIPSRFVLLCKLSLLHTLDWCELTAWRHTRYSLRAADWWSDWRHHGRHISLLAAQLSLARTVYSSNATFHDDILMVTWHVLGTGPGNGNAAVAVTAASLTTLFVNWFSAQFGASFIGIRQVSPLVCILDRSAQNFMI